ncbi:MAG: WG repeat-containing protein [Bacillota bacterium]|nr:WG repeat-containing protein [Bacillota bacterium]
MEQGRVLVPMRAIFESLGAEIVWDEATRAVTAIKGGTTVKLTIGARTAYHNETPVALEVPPVIKNGRTLVPLHFVSEALGAGTYWDGKTQTVRIVTALFPVIKNGKWGFIDASGALVISPQFDEPRLGFKEGLALVRVEGRPVFIDLSGKTAISLSRSLECNSYFAEGLAVVVDVSDPARGHVSGYIDKTGKVAIPLQFEEATEFSEGLAAVKIGGKWGYIDLTGKEIIPPQFIYAWPFSGGVARVAVTTAIPGHEGEERWKHGYIDKTGRYIVEPELEEAYDFSEGLAFVAVDGKRGYIDTTGEMVLETRLGPGIFSEGLAPVDVEGWKFGYINKAGEVVIPPSFRGAYPFSEGVALVYVNEKKWGFIDKTGDFVIAPHFLAAGSFSGGLAVVYTEEGMGYIDKTGSYVWAPQL